MEEQITRRPDGKWITAPKSPAPITHANARSMAQRRWEKYRRQAVKKIVEEAKSIDPSVSVGADAYGLVAAKQFTALMDSEKPRIADLEKLGHIMTGMDAEPRRENTPDGSDSSITASPQALMQLVSMLEESKAAAVDRARAVDADSTDIRSE